MWPSHASVLLGELASNHSESYLPPVQKSNRVVTYDGGTNWICSIGAARLEEPAKQRSKISQDDMDHCWHSVFE